MNILDRKTYKFLKRISKFDLFDLRVCDIAYIHILKAEGFVQTFGNLTPENLAKSAKWNEYLVITPKGKLYISTYRHDLSMFYIPLLIDTLLSITAIIISIIALCKQ